MLSLDTISTDLICNGPGVAEDLLSDHTQQRPALLSLAASPLPGSDK